MENEVVVILPTEVAEIAKSVSVEKREEVQNVLNQVFNGVSKMREQLDIVTVVDENDKANMKIANSIRLGVRQVRLDSEKVFDAKRSEVQQQMLSYKTEDALWLKAKQIMQISTKEIEENARWKEETKERFDKEQKELNIQQRILKVQKYSSEIQRSEFENMGDSAFELFLSSLERAYNEKVELELKAELERVEKEKADAAERERVLAENERLKKEAEAAKEKQAAIDAITKKRNDELRPFIVFIRDYNGLLEKSEIEYQKEFSDIKKGAELQWEFERKEAIKKQQEQEKKDEEYRLSLIAKAKLEAELKAKQDAELKEKQEAEAKLELERREAENAAKAPVKEQLTNWVNGFEIPLPTVSNETTLDIAKKFESFKMWAKSEINKL